MLEKQHGWMDIKSLACIFFEVLENAENAASLLTLLLRGLMPNILIT